MSHHSPCQIRLSQWAVVLVLLGATLLGLVSSRGDSAEKPAKPKEVVLPADLQLIPANAGLFVTINLGELRKRDPSEKLFPAIRKGFALYLAEWEKSLGISLDDVERITFLHCFNQPRVEPVMWLPGEIPIEAMIVRTRTNYDRRAVLGGDERSFTLLARRCISGPARRGWFTLRERRFSSWEPAGQCEP